MVQTLDLGSRGSRSEFLFGQTPFTLSSKSQGGKKQQLMALHATGVYKFNSFSPTTEQCSGATEYHCLPMSKNYSGGETIFFLKIPVLWLETMHLSNE